MQMELPLSEIRPGRWQPRQTYDRDKMMSLAASIQAQGLINRILVFADEEGRYELVAGERRWRASCALALAGEKELKFSLAQAVDFVCQDDAPAALLSNYQFVLSGHTIAAEKRSAEQPELLHQAAIVDNIQRHDLSPLEEAHALNDLKQEYGYSVRKLAEITGLSKSYISDRLGLLGLAPEAMAVGAGLDLTLVRDLARKVPQQLQGPVAAYVQERAEKGDSTKDLQKDMADLARFADPNRWSLSDGRIYRPQARNRARLIRGLLAQIPGEELAPRLLELKGNGQSWGDNYLTKKVESVLSSNWDFGKIAGVLSGAGKDGWSGSRLAWEQLAPGQGWTCENCILQNLVGGLEQRDDRLSYNLPCRRLERMNDAPVNTCDRFIGQDDPPVVEVSSQLHLALNGENPGVEIKVAGDDLVYVESWTDYHALYTAARLALDRAEEQQAIAATTAHLPAMAAYWQAQQDQNCSLALAHFQAHACHKCKFFTGWNGDKETVPCRFAEKPLRNEWSKDSPRPPKYGLLRIEATGVTVPRCEKFKYAELPPILPADPPGWQIPDRNLILNWFRVVTRHHLYENKRIYGVLAWLPDDLKKTWESLDDDRMLMILKTGLQEAQTASTYHGDVDLLDPTTGYLTPWKSLNFEGAPDAQ